MGESDHIDRRSALGGIGAGAVSLAAAGYVSGKEPGRDGTVRIGVIGCGGRARGRLMPALKKHEGLRFTAVCDVFDDHLEAGRYVAGGDGVFATSSHEKLLERDDVDAVVIATPDHWHVPMTIDAVRAGKDVYVEKPLTHDPAEGPEVIEAVRGTDRVVQVGMQQRSMPHLIEARRLVQDGVLGDLHKAHMSWNRNHTPYRRPEFRIEPEQVDWQRFLGDAPDQPFDAYKLRQWRFFWDFGNGILTDLMVHWYDAVHWMVGMGVPACATSIGANYITEGAWQTPDTIHTVMDFPDRRVQAMFEGTFVNRHNRAGTTLMGTDATLYFDRGRYELHPEPRKGIKARRKIVGNGVKGQDFFDKPDGELLHTSDWLRAIRERRDPSAPVEAGVTAAAAAHLGNRAYRQQRIAEWKELGL